MGGRVRWRAESEGRWQEIPSRGANGGVTGFILLLLLALLMEWQKMARWVRFGEEVERVVKRPAVSAGAR